MSYQIDSVKLLKQTMSAYFQRLAEADKSRNKKIAWCTSVGPAELLRSFDFEVYFPENHGALLGATRTAGDYIPYAVQQGYCNEICSYLTSDIGAYLCHQTPLKKHYQMDSIPKPDLLVYNTNQCREVEEWFGFYAREFSVPIAGIKPPRHIDSLDQELINLAVHQYKAIIPVCENASGQKFDIDKFREKVKLSREAVLLWQEVLHTARHSPSPLTFFDAVIHMGPIVVLRGTQEAKDYYTVLLKELNQKVKNNESVMDKESCRIYWEGMPVWGQLRNLSELFARQKAMIPASTYCNSWIFESFDERNPFESTATAYTEIFINRSENVKIQYLKKMIEEYKIDGIIYHDSKTCFNNSNARFSLPVRLQKETNIPYLILDGDLNDLRFYSQKQSETKLETFTEQLTEIIHK